MSINSTILTGNLASDPELRYTPNTQTAFCRFVLAVNRPKRDGEDQGADFIRITVWGKQAENCDRYLSKGRQCAVMGRIQTGSYKNRDGQTVYTTDVIADRVEFLGGAGGDNSRYNGSNSQNGITNQTQNNASQNGNFGGTGFSEMADDVPWG